MNRRMHIVKVSWLGDRRLGFGGSTIQDRQFKTVNLNDATLSALIKNPKGITIESVQTVEVGQ